MKRVGGTKCHAPGTGEGKQDSVVKLLSEPDWLSGGSAPLSFLVRSIRLEVQPLELRDSSRGRDSSGGSIVLSSPSRLPERAS